MKILIFSVGIAAFCLLYPISAQAQDWSIVSITVDSGNQSADAGSAYTVSGTRPDVRAHSEILGSDGGSTSASVQSMYSLQFVQTHATSSPKIYVDMSVDANGNITYGPNNSPDPNPSDENQPPPPGTSNEAADSSADFYQNYFPSIFTDDPAQPYVHDHTTKGTKDAYPVSGDSNPLGGNGVLLDVNLNPMNQQAELFISANVVADSSVNVSKGNTGAATGQGYVSVSPH